MAEGGFDFKKFIDESKATILAPADYFGAMAKEGGFAEPLIKAVIYAFLAGVINFIWAALHLGAAAGALGGMIGGGIGVMGLVMSVIGGIIGLFIGGAIVLVISAICGGDTSYEANVRVTASMMVLSPVSAVFGFLSSISLWLGGIVSILVSLYGIFLLYTALTKALGGKEGVAKVVSIILAAIPVLMILSTLLCMKGASTLQNEMMKNVPVEDQQKVKDLMNKALEEAKKQQQ